jgi:sterol desaturase/sphingolipid hydroxylase (fatty acid hydroxylase superfamily)
MTMLPETLVASKAFVVAGWLIAFFVLERIRPAAERARLEGCGPPSRLRRFLGDPARLLRNGCLWFVNAASGSLIVVPITAWAGGLAIGLRPAWLSGWAGLVFDLILLDFWIYWWHRINHTLPWLWRFHAIHHLDRFLDSTSAARFHPGEIVLSALVRAVAILLLGIPLTSVLVFETVILMAAIFHHSNLSLPGPIERLLARLIITPSVHWVHHHAVRRDTDSNYGTILSIWDPLFGTRSGTRRQLDMTIGVEGEGEEPLMRLLLRPFRARRP